MGKSKCQYSTDKHLGMLLHFPNYLYKNLLFVRSARLQNSLQKAGRRYRIESVTRSQQQELDLLVRLGRVPQRVPARHVKREIYLNRRRLKTIKTSTYSLKNKPETLINYKDINLFAEKQKSSLPWPPASRWKPCDSSWSPGCWQHALALFSPFRNRSGRAAKFSSQIALNKYWTTISLLV